MREGCDKSSLQALNEMATQKGLTPFWHEPDPVGPPHQREFMVKLSWACAPQQIVAEGCASTRKGAKQQAARNALDLVKPCGAASNHDNTQSSGQEQPMSPPMVSGSSSTNSNTTPMTPLMSLNEMATQKGLTPFWHEPDPVGPPHRREFMVKLSWACAPQQIVAEGYASTRKGAKQQAASSGLESFTEHGVQTAESAETEQQDAFAAEGESQQYAQQTRLLMCWTVDEVYDMVKSCGEKFKADSFRDEGIDGEVLLEMTDEEFQDDIGLTKLQTKRLRKEISKI